jgi:cytidine deaminase
MKEISFQTNLKVFSNLEELPKNIQILMEEAIIARNNAYAPYSKFKVGAALVLENDEIVIGSNQENAAYPSGLCAERVAIFQAGSKFPGKIIKTLAITAASETNKTDKPIPPCGACRQAIAEYEFKQEQPIEIYFMGETGEIYLSDSLSNLLPFSFDKTSL